MAQQAAPTSEPVVLTVPQFAELISALSAKGYLVVGPSVTEGGIVFREIEGINELPRGWTAQHAPGRFRLQPESGSAFFGYANTAQGLKRYLLPPDTCLFAAARENGAFHILRDNQPAPRYAFLGVRACDLASLARLDRVLADDAYQDPGYKARRASVLLIAVTCNECADTCFCESMGGSREPAGGYDILLTEHATDGEHHFTAAAATAAGRELLAAVAPHASAVPHDNRPRAPQSRAVATAGLREMLYDNFDHPRWEQVAARCLSCGNCTMSCPTCFCTTVEDTSDVTQHRAERWRRWDSCFTQSFSYIHGGSVRLSPKSRYRQWLTHKFAAWVDQFGEFGCVGCGRCITWCPAGIDITEEIAALRG